MSAHAPCPLLLRPVYKETPWGGAALRELYGRELPAGRVGESWELSGHPGGLSVVENGPSAGRALPEVLQEDPAGLLGRAGTLALMLKLISAQAPLSVQVHPDDRRARALGQPRGKTELWLALHASPGAGVWAGLSGPLSPEALRRHIAENTLERVLRFHPLAAGDAVLLPAGTVHAIGPGLVLAEIQQESDCTFRFYDWGRGRPLHVEEALAALDPAAQPTVQPGARVDTAPGQVYRRELPGCEYFTGQQIKLGPGALAREDTGGTYAAFLSLSPCTLRYAGGIITLPAARTCFLPAALGDFEVFSPQPAEYCLFRQR